MRTKAESFTAVESQNENYINDNKLTSHENKNNLYDKSSLDRQLERNKENEFEKKLLKRDSGNVIGVEEEHTNKSESENIKSCPVQSVKHPLHRKSSNITNDSGRSTVSDLGDNDTDLQSELNEFQSDPSNDIADANRRESLTVIDSTGHLSLPPPVECVQSFLQESDNSELGTTECRPQSAHTSCDSQSSPRHLQKPVNGNVLSRRYAPKIVTSSSEDSSLIQRSLSYQYSPYSSPTASPRLRRQPTMETRRISLSEGGDGYIQLNQYKLKDEIGKVNI